MTEQSFLESAVIYMSAAVIAVPIFKRLGLGAVLGYLVAGMAIGPWGLKLISDVETIFHFSEFGVVLLMFLIGLELKPAMLWNLRRSVFGIGSMQVGISALLLGLCGFLLGLAPLTAVLAAFALAMSSTPIALQSLEERGLAQSEAGRSAFSVLLFQDLAVIPILAVVPILGSQGGPDPSGIEDYAKPFAIILLIVVGGRFVLRHLFRVIAETRLREVFTAFSLLIVVGTGLLMQQVGISMALGTFLAGVLLAESEYRHELELNLEPFKGLLLGLFFIAVGMTVDFSLLIQSPLPLLALTFGFVAVKLMVLMAIARPMGLMKAERSLFAILLGQGGEFAFVLISASAQGGLIEAELAAKLVVIATLSMLITPFMLFFYDRFICPKACQVNVSDSDVKDEGSPVIIAGYGRFGQITGRLLMSLGYQITVVDNNPSQIEMLRKFGFKVYYGDASRMELLEAAGAAKAKVLVLATDDMEQLVETARQARARFPHLKILARASGRAHVNDLKDAGIEDVRRETFGSALEIGELTLRSLGFGAHQAHKAALKFRAYDEKMIEMSHQYRGDEKKSIAFAIQARQQLETLMQADQEELDIQSNDWGGSA